MMDLMLQSFFLLSIMFYCTNLVNILLQYLPVGASELCSLSYHTATQIKMSIFVFYTEGII